MKRHVSGTALSVAAVSAGIAAAVATGFGSATAHADSPTVSAPGPSAPRPDLGGSIAGRPS